MMAINMSHTSLFQALSLGQRTCPVEASEGGNESSSGSDATAVEAAGVTVKLL